MRTSAGFFSNKGGLEFPLTLDVAALALTIGGPGRFSRDETIGYPLTDPWIGITAFVVGAVATERVDR